MNNPNDFLVGIDVGSHKVLCVIGRPAEEPGFYNVLGYSFVESQGVRNGIVTELESARAAIAKAIDEARFSANLPLPERAWVAIGGKTLTSENCVGTAVVRGREVKASDVEAAETSASEHSRRENKQLVKMVLQGYVCGDTRTSTPPIGLTGEKISAHYHAVYGSVTNAENMKRCLLRSGVELAGYEPHPWAAARAVLMPEDRYCGTVVFDMGAETTSITLVYENEILFTDVRPYGSEFFTRDVSSIFGVSLEQAEDLKVNAGHCFPDEVLPGEGVQPKSVDGRPAGVYSRVLLARTLRARADELFKLYKALLADAGMLDKVHCVVLTGGGANLRGIADVAHEIFDVPVRIGRPLCLRDGRKVPVLATLPEASVAVGLLASAGRSRAEGDRGYRTKSFSNLQSKIKTLLCGDY